MTEDEMRRGFAKGRRLTQEDNSTDDEKRTVDKLAAEGVCTATPWAYDTDLQCHVRHAKGVIASEAKQSSNPEEAQA